MNNPACAAVRTTGVLLAALSLTPVLALAADDASQASLDVLRTEVEHQRRQLEVQQQELRMQRQRLLELEQALAAENVTDPAPARAMQLDQPTVVKPGDSAALASGGYVSLSEDEMRTLRGAGEEGSGQGAQPVGQAPEREEPRPEITAISDVGGVLTPRGRLVIEPSVEYSHSSTRRFFFSGVEIVDAVLIGAIEAEDARRDTVTAALVARYGITNRLEVDLRVPYVWRDDIELDPTDDDMNDERRLRSHDLGDLEIGAHYQLNDGLNGWPYFVGNLRFKTRTGEGPFDVPLDSAGRQLEVPTGSGFYSLEPSLTFLYPTDPVILFGNIGYNYTFEDDVDESIGTSTFGEVDPGDSVSMSVGFGFGINQKFSFNLGYDHNIVFGTESEVNGQRLKSNRIQVGSLLFGMSFRPTLKRSISMNVAVGVTEDAPDIRVTFRMPWSFDL